MTREEADKYWELFYQGKKDAFDYANILMKREEYNNASSKSGWTIDYKDVKKIALNEKEQLANTFPCSITAKNIRQDKQHFFINGREFNFLVDEKTKTKKLYEIKGKEKKCVDPHQRVEERMKDSTTEKIMEISGVKIKARQEINGDLVLVANEEEQLVTSLFSLADYIEKFKRKIKDNKNILVEISQKLGKNYEIPTTLFISTEKNKSEEILLLRELILNKENTTFDYNEEEKTLYCYDEKQTHKNEYIKKQMMLEDEIYYLAIKIKDHEGFLSFFFSEEYDDASDSSSPEIDASFTFNLNKHTLTREMKKQEQEEEKEEEKIEPEEEQVIESKFSHRFDTLLNINKEKIKKDLEKLSLEKTKKEMKELEEKVAKKKLEEKQEKEYIQENQKLKDFIEHENYKTQAFKKEDLQNNNAFKDRTQTLLDTVAFSIAKEIKDKIKEKDNIEEEVEEQEVQEELNDINPHIEKLSLEEEKVEVEPEVEKKEIDDQPITITAEFAKKAIENQEAITEKLGELNEEEFAGITPKEIDDTPNDVDEEEMYSDQEQEEQEQDYYDQDQKYEEETSDQDSEESEEIEEKEIEYQTQDNKEKEKEEIIAKQLFRKIYGEQVKEGKDFAGRKIKIDNYAKEESETGWNYILLTDSFGIDIENVILANIKSLKEFNMNKKFISNGNEFYVTKKGDKTVLISDQVLTNPFNFSDAKRLAFINKKQTKKLCYIFVKCTEADGLNIKLENFNIFFDFVYRSKNKILGDSLVNFEVGRDYIFLSFDLEKEEAIKDAYYYAVLLNSYRKELKKERILNAIIVLSKIEVPLSYVNKSCKEYIFDLEFRSIYEKLSQKQVDITIKRAIHISPEVLNEINLDRNQLKKSLLLQEEVDEEYYECNNVYLLSKEE